MATYIVRILERDGDLRGQVSDVATGTAHTFTDATALLAFLSAHGPVDPEGTGSTDAVVEPSDAEPGARPVALRPGPAERLTSSQLRVCRQAMLGKSNASIARELFISRATVESHLHASYQKLGIASRLDLRSALFRTAA